MIGKLNSVATVLAVAATLLAAGPSGTLEPRWLNAMDLLVTQSEGAKCSIRRYKAVDGEGVPTGACTVWVQAS